MHTDKRFSGRTTTCILDGVREALEMSGKSVIVLDHSGSMKADEYVANKVSEILTLLGIKHTLEKPCIITVESMK